MPRWRTRFGSISFLKGGTNRFSRLAPGGVGDDLRHPEGPALHAAARRTHQSLGSCEHLLRGATGEGQEQDAVGRYTALDEVRDAVDEGPRLPAAGAGAAAMACLRLYVQMGLRKENVILTDRHGVIYKGMVIPAMVYAGLAFVILMVIGDSGNPGYQFQLFDFNNIP